MTDTKHPSLSEQRALELLNREIEAEGIAENHALRRAAHWRGEEGHTKRLETAAVRAIEAAFAQPPASGVDPSREAAFVAFALRCSSQNPAAIGPARNEAVELLERFGIEPRERGLFYHDLAADERAAQDALTNSGAPVPVTYDERVEYEERILAAEMQAERLKRTLKPFADKADKWEANHAYSGRDSTQVQHRLGDFRAARTAIKEATDEG